MKDFTDYLENTYEKDPLLSEAVHLKINYDATEPKSNRDLIHFLQMPKRRCIYKIDLIPEPLSTEQVNFNRLLRKVYLEMKSPKGSSAHEAMPIIRKAKKNWVEEKKAGPIGLQIQCRSQEQRGKEPVNELSAVGSEKILLKEIYKAVGQIEPELDKLLLQSLTDKTKLVIAMKKKEVPSLIYGLTLLLNLYRTNDKNELIRFHNFLGKLEITNEHTLKLWMKILISLGENSTSAHLGLLLDVQEKLETHSTLLNSIGGLFDNLPYPDLNQFVVELGKSKKELKSYIESFDKDPKAARAPQYNEHGRLTKTTQQILDEQFDISQLHRVVTKMKNLVEEGRLTHQLQYKLTQQVIYINAIGKDHPLTVDSKLYSNLTTVSRSELHKLSEVLITQVRNPVLSDHAKMKAKLNLLAVMREQYFRTTGQFLDTTQILSILMSLNYQQSNLLMEMDSEERQNATTAVLAAMQWVVADGGIVDVCMRNRDLVKENYLDNGVNHFFASLGISSAVIEADDPAGTYQVGGINYSTFVDLVFYRSRAKRESENLIAKKLGTPLSSNLIINGRDCSTIDERIVFDLVENTVESEPNPYAWIYPLINEFVNQKEFRNVDVLSGDVWDEEQDLANLKQFLNTHAPTESHRGQLDGLSDLKLNTWINLACRVQQLVGGEDYTIISTNTPTYVAAPRYQSSLSLQENYTFSKEAQYFLHAHLQKKYPSKHFVIESEKKVIDSVPAKDLFDVYKEQGRIVGLFGRLDRALDKQRNLLNIDVAYQVPSHYKKHERDRFDTPPSANNVEHLKKIKKIVAQARAGQPVILLATDTNHVKELFHELSEQFAKDGRDIQIGAFTGEESEEIRKNWAKNNAGQFNTITITTSLLIKDITFDTEHEEGFLGIQTSLDTSRKTGKFIDRLAGDGKPGQYVAIYEENGLIFSNSWPFQPETNRERILEEVDRIQRKKNQEIAVERYYTQTVSSMQMVVLKQFDEWQALLHLIYPQNAWKKLDQELFAQREDLISSLAEQWNKCLENSDPEHVYPNPYIRRDRNKKLQTSALDNALQEYEKAMEFIWITHRNVLKEKTEGRIKEESINALRCNYLEEVVLSEQLHLQKLALRQQKITTVLDRKKASRVVDSGLDVNGAMLAYSDVPKEEYRAGFSKNQLKLLVKDTIQEIERSSLSANAKSLFIQRLNRAENFLALEQVLKDYYAKNLPEKYRMQPILCELIRIYNYSGIPETVELQELKRTYIDNVAFEIVENLEQSLSWSFKENRGLFYWLERTAVKKAAQEILSAVDGVKKATDTPSRQLALKNLYKLLIQHQAQLEGLWIFSFGHQNTRTLINQTLKTLDNLTVIGSGSDQLNASFIQECQEEAHSDVMKKQFESALEKIERQNSSWLKNNPQWIAIKEQLQSIQSDNNTVYVMDDLYYFLSKMGKELNYSNSPVFKPVIELRGELRSIWNKFSQDHKDLISQTKHFEYKAVKLQESLEGLNGYEVKGVRIKPAHTGFNEYFDLIIEGTGSHPLLDSFLHYKPNISVLKQKRISLVSLQEQKNARISVLQELQKEQFPVLGSRENKPVDPTLFPESCRAQVRDILLLKDLAVSQLPDDLNGFSPKEQNLFFDRDLVRDWEPTQLTLEQIERLKDKQLKSEFIDLYNKINGINPEPSPSFFSRVVSFLVSPFLGMESSEDLRYQFDELKRRPQNQLTAILQRKIDEKLKALTSHLTALQMDVVGSETLAEQIEFLEEKIAEEDRKSSVIIKRFKNLDQLYDFEMELRNFKAAQSPVPMIQSSTEQTLEGEEEEDILAAEGMLSYW